MLQCKVMAMEQFQNFIMREVGGIFLFHDVLRSCGAGLVSILFVKQQIMVIATKIYFMFFITAAACCSKAAKAGN